MGAVDAYPFSAPRALRDSDDLEGFDCGVDLLNAWVANRAHGAKAAGTAVVYCSFAEGRLAGFYTLSAQSVERRDARGWITRNAPAQVPVILLGMLGVDRTYHGYGLGRALLLDAVHRAQSISDQLGARALVVDPIDDAARAFYAKYGFVPLPGTTRMFAKLR